MTNDKTAEDVANDIFIIIRSRIATLEENEDAIACLIEEYARQCADKALKDFKDAMDCKVEMHTSKTKAKITIAGKDGES